MRRHIGIVAYAWFPNIQALMESLQRRVPYEIKHFVLSGSDQYRAWCIKDGLTVEPIIVPSLHLSVFSRSMNLNLTMAKHLARIDPAAIVVKGWADPSCLVVRRFAQMRRVPLITWMSGRDYEATRKISGRVLRSVANVVARRMIRDSCYVFVYGSRARLEALRLGADPAKVVAVKQTIDESHFDYRRNSLSDSQRNAIRARLGLDERPLFLCIAQLVQRKGIQDLLESYGRLLGAGVDAQLLLIGNGPLRHLVEAALGNYSPRFVWLPAVPYEDIPKFYAAADCLVLPSRFDTWGNVINESHCARLPVITSNGAHAAADLVEHGKSGLVYEAGEVACLAELMRYTVEHRDEMKCMARQGNEKIYRNWNVEESAEIWSRYILRAIKQSCEG